MTTLRATVEPLKIGIERLRLAAEKQQQILARRDAVEVNHPIDPKGDARASR